MTDKNIIYLITYTVVIVGLKPNLQICVKPVAHIPDTSDTFTPILFAKPVVTIPARQIYLPLPIRQTCSLYSRRKNTFTPYPYVKLVVLILT